MRPVTVLHCSDLHLGRVLPQGRSEELQMTFEDLILLGEQRKADLFSHRRGFIRSAGYRKGNW